MIKIKIDIIATVNVDDSFLKSQCFLFMGSKVKIIKQRGNCFEVQTMAGKKVTMKKRELNFTKKNLKLLNTY